MLEELVLVAARSLFDLRRHRAPHLYHVMYTKLVELLDSWRSGSASGRCRAISRRANSSWQGRDEATRWHWNLDVLW